MLAQFTRYRRGAAVVAALLAAGCSLPTDNDDRPALAIQYFQLESPPPPGTPPAINVRVAPHALQVEGPFVVPCATARDDVRHQIDGDDITIRIIFSSGTGCSEGKAIRYVASLLSVPAGSYDLTVIHEGDAQVATGTAVFEGPVVVPSPPTR